jgi:DeoR family glycerol-3-phosphate regulon repressor
MHKTARQKYIIDIISENGQASISDLVETLHVSADTIRRDLSDLEKQGWRRKTTGAQSLSISPPCTVRAETPCSPHQTAPG